MTARTHTVRPEPPRIATGASCPYSGPVTALERARVHLVLAIVGAVFDIDVSALLSPTRGTSAEALARQIGMYLAHTTLGVNRTRIARVMGRDRSTVSHAVTAIEDMRDDRELNARIEALEASLALNGSILEDLREAPPSPTAGVAGDQS